jgi:hypothetical protein
MAFFCAIGLVAGGARPTEEKLPTAVRDVQPRPIAKDPTVK